jgi:DMSO/TMAO reductase YedYZ molybdopterin-dependent catalytic subunit
MITVTRRALLRTGAVSATGLMLGGCDIMDGLSASDHPVRNLMEMANGLTYRAQRVLSGNRAMAQEFLLSDIRQPQRPNGVTNPGDADYKALAADGFRDYRLRIGGLVQRPLEISLPQLHAMPARTQITRHDCVEGWSCIAQWTGVPLAHLLALARPLPAACFALFNCFDTIERSLSGLVKYYETIDMADALHPQTILAYGMNGSALPVANGAPVRLRVERQLGYKMAKYVHAIELVASFAQIGDGKGGYWEDRGYDWYAGI